MRRLTTIIPMHNSARTVEAAIRSVQAQRIEGLSIVVVNDGSTDDGARVVERLGAEDLRITLLSQANKGLAGARNTGLERALRMGAEFLHFLDADDWMLPGAYEALLDAAAETGAAYGGYELADERGERLGRESPISAPYVGLDEELEWNRAATHARLVTRQAIGGHRFDESLRVCEDLDLWLRLETDGVRFKAVERMVCGYRLRPSSLSKRFGEMCEVYEAVTRRAFERASQGVWIDRIDLSQRRFRRVVGHSAILYATMQALAEVIPGKPRAAALIERASHPGRFSPGALAQAASTALLLGACTAPVVDGSSERLWLTSLRQWWVRCAEEHLIGFEDIDAAMAELAVKIVHPDAVCASMLDSAQRTGRAREQGVVIIGLDRNSRRLARLAARRGWRVLVLDDFTDAAEARLLEPPAGVRVARLAAEFAAATGAAFAAAPWITGQAMLDAQSIVQRTARAAEISPRLTEMWEDHRRRLGAANLSLMQTALRAPMAKAG